MLKKKIVSYGVYEKTLLHIPVPYCLCTDQDQFEHELKLRGIEPYYGLIDGKGATTHFFTKKNEVEAAVCLYDHSRELYINYALLVHEAMHIWREIRKKLGEDDPSQEFEAYAIQRISQDLFYEFNNQRAERRKQRRKKK